MKVELDVRQHLPGSIFKIVQCKRCGVYYEPEGKKHKCSKKKVVTGDNLKETCRHYEKRSRRCSALKDTYCIKEKKCVFYSEGE